MLRVTGTIAIWLLAWVVSGCGLMSGGGKAEERARKEAAEAAGAMPAGLMRTGDDALAGGATATLMEPTAGGAPVVAAEAGAVIPESDIVWTDPDDPDAEIPELDTVLKSPSRGPWEQSETIAAKRAAREGKCLMIWFTDSRRSPMCKALSAELFGLQEFETWAAERFVRLRVDANVTERDEDKRSRMLDYVENLRRRHKVLGNPTVVVCAPQGDVITRYRGYSRGQSDFYWGRLKSAELAGHRSYESWRKGLEKRGYREWSDRQGRKVFARLNGYKSGELWLVEPDGTQSKTEERKLSEADRLWMAGQKKARGIQ